MQIAKFLKNICNFLGCVDSNETYGRHDLQGFLPHSETERKFRGCHAEVLCDRMEKRQHLATRNEHSKRSVFNIQSIAGRDERYLMKEAYCSTCVFHGRKRMVTNCVVLRLRTEKTPSRLLLRVPFESVHWPNESTT
jgi:hypothetical protein